MREGVIDNRKLTPYRGLDEVLIEYAHTSRAVLGDNFVGIYLLGSLAIGDFDLTLDAGRHQLQALDPARCHPVVGRQSVPVPIEHSEPAGLNCTTRNTRRRLHVDVFNKPSRSQPWTLSTRSSLDEPPAAPIVLG